MSYPFTTFPLVNRVGVTNPYAAVDARYGPWNTRNDALTSFNAGLRSQGLTLGIIESERVVEYWYRDGVSDTNLILKTPDINISNYLPLSGGTITGNLSVFGILSSSYIKNINEIALEAEKVTIKTPYPWSQAIFSHKNSSEFLIQSGSENYLNVFSISSLYVNVESPIQIQNSLRVENNFDSAKSEPINSFSFIDEFVEPFNSLELNSHIPNIFIPTAPNNPLSLADTSWTRIFQSNASAKLMVYANTLEARPETSQAFQGVIYQAETYPSTNNNYEIKVFLNEISPANPTNFDVFWLLARVIDVNNFYAVRFGVKSGDCALYRKSSGTFTLLKQLPNLNPNFGNNLNFSLRVYDNKISVFYNNGLVSSHIDNVLNSGKVGLAIGNIGVRGNDSIDIRTRFKRIDLKRYSEFERDSYILNNDFGIGTRTPNEKLTVSGNISSNNLIYALGGNSQQWNSNFTTVCTLSSQWSQGTNIIPIVTNYLSTNNVFFSSVSIVSGSNSFRWTEAYTAVAANSATTWNYQGTDVKNLTSKYENLFTFVQNTSSNWEESAEILPTVTNHLSTNQVQVSSLVSRNGVYDAGYFWNQYQAPNNNNWQSVTYGNGLFVGIANSNVITPNKIMTSPDGINWTLRQVPVQNNWTSITYGNGLFVAVADDGTTVQRFLISSDTVNWIPLTAGSPIPNTGVAYGNGRFVIVADPSNFVGPVANVFRSFDGINWKVAIDPIGYKGLTYGDEKFLAFTNTQVLSSQNGLDFNIIYTNLSEQFTGITYGNGLFLVTSNTGSVYSAKADSTNYTRIINANPNFTNSRPYYANGLYFIISRDTGVWVSQDTTNWHRPISNLTGSAFRDICYGNGVYVLLANGLANNNNIFVSGKIKNIENNEFNPRYGGLNLYGNLTSNNLVIASSGNSQLWTEVYTRVAANSSTWNAAGSPNVNLSSIFATVCSLSTNWNSVYNTTCALSTNWSSIYSYWNPITANTSSAVSFVNTNSANIINVNTKVNNTSANWDSGYSQLCALSAKWNTPYDTALNINSTNAVQNSAIAVKIQSLENGLNILVPAPTYNAPIALLTNFPNSVYEVGATAIQTITLGFTRNNAGSATNYRLERNGFFLGQQTFGFSYNVNEIVVQGTTNYQNTVTYVDGLIENNLLGLPDSRGRILAGSTSTIRSYTGRYRQFFGSVSSVPTNLRTLTGNNFDDVNTFSFYAHQVNNVLAIPASKSLQSAVTQNNETVTSNFALSSVFVNNANGVPVSYKRYVQTTNVPFNVNITFTLSTP